MDRSGKNASGTKKLSKFTLEKKNDFLIVFDFSNLSGTKMQREGDNRYMLVWFLIQYLSRSSLNAHEYGECMLSHFDLFYIYNTGNAVACYSYGLRSCCR